MSKHSKTAQAVIDRYKGTRRVVQSTRDWWTGDDDEIVSPRVQRIRDLQAGRRVVPLVTRKQPVYAPRRALQTASVERHGTGVGNQDNITDRVRKALAEGADYLETKK